MFNRIQFRDIIAWLALAVAIILFSVTIAFAQTKTISVDRENGKVHLKIIKIDDNGTVKIDTTFDATDDAAVEETIDRLINSDNDGSSHVRYHNKSDNGKKKMRIMIDSDYPNLTQEQKDKLHEEWRESMEDMRKGIEKMKESMKDLHVHLDVDSDFTKDFHFNFDMDDENGNKENDCNSYSYSYKYSHKDDDIDSLRDKDHIVIIGHKDESPPVLEKVIETKNGKQVFIYKRSGNSKNSSKSGNNSQKEKQKEKPDIRNLSYYPNPTDGKFQLNFNAEKESDYTIQVLDSQSKVVFSEKLNSFEGEYSREIDLGSKSKGNYFLKIMQGERSVTKKIVVD